MPLSEPRGTSSSGNGPIIASRRLFPASSVLSTADEINRVMYSPLEKRLVLLAGNAAVRFIGMESADGYGEEFANHPGQAIVDTALQPDYANGSGFLFWGDTTAQPFRASSCIPSSATFSALTVPAVGTDNLFSLANGETVAIDGTSVYVSTDGGVTWGAPFNITINGNTDLSHVGIGPFISQNGALVALSSVTGLGITDDVSAGTGGLLGNLATGAYVYTGAFNDDASAFVFLLNGGIGNVQITESPFTTFSSLSFDNNPVGMRAGAGQGIRGIVYSKAAGGWLIGGSPGTGFAALLRESDLRFEYGYMLDAATWGQPVVNHTWAADKLGKLIGCGDDMTIMSPTFS